MPTNAHVSYTTRIPAPPARIWTILTDYRVHHPAILPKPAFDKLEVLAGGVGAGTRFRLTMRLGGAASVAEMGVTTPRPGHTLVEATDDGSTVTHFILEPADGGQATDLTFATDYTLPGGALAVLYRWLVNRTMRGLYQQEMANIARYIAEDHDR